MSRLGVRKHLIMAYKITSSVAYEWKRAGEPSISAASSLSLNASSPEKRERRKPAERSSMAVEDVDSPHLVSSGSVGALCFKTACLLEDSRRHAAIRYIDPLCPLSAPRSTDVVSVMVFAERWVWCCTLHRCSAWSLCVRAKCFKILRPRPLPLQICGLMA